MQEKIISKLQKEAKHIFIFAKSMPLSFSQDKHLKKFDLEGEILPNRVIHNDI